MTQAYFMQLLIKINNAKKILEVGTFTGYSALSMALATKDDGLVTCLDKNEKTSEKAKYFFNKAKLDDKVMTIFGPALDSLKKFAHDKKIFDLVFIDANKKNYIKYFNISLDIIKKKGIIIIDNEIGRAHV